MSPIQITNPCEMVCWVYGMNISTTACRRWFPIWLAHIFSYGLKTSTKHTSQYFINPILGVLNIPITTTIPYWRWVACNHQLPPRDALAGAPPTFFSQARRRVVVDFFVGRPPSRPQSQPVQVFASGGKLGLMARGNHHLGCPTKPWVGSWKGTILKGNESSEQNIKYQGTCGFSIV